MINRILKLVRQYNTMTQTELSEKLGISKSYLSEIESGKKIVSLDLLEKYSEVYEIPVSSLIFFSESLGKKEGIPERFRNMFTGKVLNFMEWILDKNEAKKIQA